MSSENNTARNITLLVTNLAIMVGANACRGNNQPQPEIIPTSTVSAEITPLPTLTFTPPATETMIFTLTPEPTKTPEVSFNCPVNPDSPNMTEITSLADLPKLAEWALKQPPAMAKISNDPSLLDYTFDVSSLDGRGQLGAQLSNDPGWSARHTTFIGTCKINPSILGFPGKDTGRLLISVIQDKNNRRAIQFNFAAEHSAREMFNEFQFTDTEKNWIVILDDASSWDDPDFIPQGASPGGPSDLRPMQDSDTFFAAQGTSRAEVDAMLQEIATTDVFSDDTVKEMHSTVFYTGTGWNLRK